MYCICTAYTFMYMHVCVYLRYVYTSILLVVCIRKLSPLAVSLVSSFRHEKRSCIELFFSTEFMDFNYFFDTEEALANGKELPSRPKPFFVPDGKSMSGSSGSSRKDDDLSAIRHKSKASSSSSSSTSSDKSFGKK